MPMRLSSARALLLAAAVASLPTLAPAQTIPKEKGAARSFAQFHFLCLRHLPDIEGIERAAGFGEYDQLLGEDLAPYTPDTPFEKLLAWRFHDQGGEFILTAMRTRPDEALRREMPAYAATRRTACALQVPNDKPELLLDEVTRSVRRPPDASSVAGGMRIYAWTQQAPGSLSRIELHVPESGSAKAVLEASVYSK